MGVDSVEGGVVIPVTDSRYSESTVYDLAVISVGFEWRSSHLVRRGLKGRVSRAFTFEDCRVHSFERNRELARAGGYEIIESSRSSYRRDIRSSLELLGPEAGATTPCVAIDISSMTRIRMAHTVLEVLSYAERVGPLDVEFVYSPATFPGAPPAVGVLEAGPVVPEFRGTLRPASVPVGVVLGVGYEPQRAVGAYELLEPGKAWAFVPSSGHGQYDEAIAVANRALYGLIDEDAIVDYPVLSPVSTFYTLDSFLYASSGDYRVVLIPMGPKVFALCCYLAALGVYGPKPAVWRVGEARYGDPLEIEEEGKVVGLRAELGRERDVGLSPDPRGGG
jgi:hypothetical protein